MAGLKSLGLVGAKKALRKFFGRTLAAGDEVTATTVPASVSHDAITASAASKNFAASSTASSLQQNTGHYSAPESRAEDIDFNYHSTAADLTATKAKNDQKFPLSTNTADSEGDPQPTMNVTSSARHDDDKENQPPIPNEKTEKPVHKLAQSLGALQLNPRHGLPHKAEPGQEQDDHESEKGSEQDEEFSAILNDPALMAERARHLSFMEQALDMARLALRTNETPVGCVLVHNDQVVAKGMNATNVTRNGTRHAEFMAISALLSYPHKDRPRTTSLKPNVPPQKVHHESEEASDTASVESEWRPPNEGNEDGSKGHLYPYGQRCNAPLLVDRQIIHECTLYVTVEPCVMCASLLRQMGIKKVYFGAVNDKFGGTGGVFSIHANSLPVGHDGQTSAAHPMSKPIQYPDGGGSLGTSFPPGGGDGGNVERGFEIEGGWGRDEAVGLLRRFYVQENGRAPVPRKKEGRAARLAAMMKEGEEGDGEGDIDGEIEGDNVGKAKNTVDEKMQSTHGASSDEEADDEDGENLNPSAIKVPASNGKSVIQDGVLEEADLY